MTIEAIFLECARRGIHLRADGDLIKYSPPDVVDGDAELLDAMRRNKPALLAELRRDAAVADAWEFLRAYHARAGQPAGWFTADVHSAEVVVSELWVSSRNNPDDDARFKVALGRWVAVTRAAIEEATADRGPR